MLAGSGFHTNHSVAVFGFKDQAKLSFQAVAGPNPIAGLGFIGRCFFHGESVAGGETGIKKKVKIVAKSSCVPFIPRVDSWPMKEKTAWIKVKVPVPQHRRFKALAAMHGLTIEKLVRVLIDRKLESEEPERRVA